MDPPPLLRNPQIALDRFVRTPEMNLGLDHVLFAVEGLQPEIVGDWRATPPCRCAEPSFGDLECGRDQSLRHAVPRDLGIAKWPIETSTDAGGEGMVVKPADRLWSVRGNSFSPG